MSSNMYWKPTEDVQEDREVPTPLKIILKHADNEILTEEDIGYLRGLCDAGINPACRLITAIRKHKSITLFEVW